MHRKRMKKHSKKWKQEIERRLMDLYNYSTMATDELLENYRRAEQVDPMDKAGVRKQMRMALFQRGVDNINGIPLSVLLRNPLIQTEYNQALGL